MKYSYKYEALKGGKVGVASSWDIWPGILRSTEHEYATPTPYNKVTYNAHFTEYDVGHVLCTMHAKVLRILRAIPGMNVSAQATRGKKNRQGCCNMTVGGGTPPFSSR
jgi:hypothetical protein